MVSYILPEAFENGADVVADGKLVIELASGSSMFNIWKRKEIPEVKSKVFPTRIHLQYKSLLYCLQCDGVSSTRLEEVKFHLIQKSSF